MRRLVIPRLERADSGLLRMRHISEAGQSMVLFGLLLVVLFGMLALVMDGGYAFLQRREAQTAADAGALAGARELCITGDAALATNAAIAYAISRNSALEADVSIIDGEVQVTTRIPFPTFFGRVLGRPSMTSSALAAAGCFAPSAANGILPVAWNCSPPIGGSDSPDCQIIYNKLYVIMDSKGSSDDFYCQDPPNSGLPAGALDCDYDDDGLNDVLAGGDRSWLDLNGGGGGSSELVDWINGGFVGEVYYHTWFGGQSGVANDVFQAAHGRVGDYVLFPVFDQYCDGGLPESFCPAYYHAQDTTVPSGGTATLYYHVITFALFYITCVDAPPYGPCPGHEAAGLPNNVMTIEGFFVKGFVKGIKGRPSDGVDAGAYTLYLTR
jgi:hypothetical protein